MSSGNTILDIGVNNGVITIGAILSKDFNFSIGVDGCEEHIESCRKNLKLNNIENSVKLFKGIVSDQKTFGFISEIKDQLWSTFCEW